MQDYTWRRAFILTIPILLGYIPLAIAYAVVAVVFALTTRAHGNEVLDKGSAVGGLPAANPQE